MQDEKIKSSVWLYPLKTDCTTHTINLVVLWDSWTSVSQDKMIFAHKRSTSNLRAQRT